MDIYQMFSKNLVTESDKVEFIDIPFHPWQDHYASCYTITEISWSQNRPTNLIMIYEDHSFGGIKEHYCVFDLESAVFEYIGEEYFKKNLRVKKSHFENKLNFIIHEDNLIIENITKNIVEFTISGIFFKDVCVNPILPYFAIASHHWYKVALFKINEKNFEFQNIKLNKNLNDNKTQSAKNKIQHMSIKQALLHNVAINQIGFTLQELSKIVGSTDEIVMLMNRFNTLNKNVQLGICENENLERNKITHALINYINELKI